MLCDLLLGPWADPSKHPTFEPEVERLIKLGQEKPEGHEEEFRNSTVTRDRMTQVLAAIEAWLASGLHLSEAGGIGFHELPRFQDLLQRAQKFFVSPEFARTSLLRFSTPETVVKAKEWFQLIHDPMWLEWYYEARPGFRLGALFYSRALAGGERAYWCYLVEGLVNNPRGSATKMFSIYHYRLLPTTVRMEDNGFYMDVEADDGMEIDTNDFARQLACYAYDFIIRINSPRITEFRPCDDLTKINKKRLRLGRAPLCTYQIVDLNRAIKAQLRQTESESEGGVRFHWRRGHFKARKTGIFWWSPHTAGRKVNGEVEKEYVA